MSALNPSTQLTPALSVRGLANALSAVQVRYLSLCWMGESLNSYGVKLLTRDRLNNVRRTPEGDAVLACRR